LWGNAQNSISGLITDSTATGVPFVPVALLNSKDSTIVKGVLSDEGGKFRFAEIKPGTYLLRVNAVGYSDTLSELISLDSSSQIQLPLIRLQRRDVLLNEVAITAVKKPVEFKNGNIIVNIENSPLAIGNSVYDLLSRLPGVTVDEAVISIQGKQGVRIYIDERLQPMTGTQLVNLLKSMNASSIEKIEVLKNPPSKYDAAGTGGIINIKTKRVKVTGFSGSANTSYTQGFYANKGVGFSLNYKGKNVAVFSNFNGGDDALLHVIQANRFYTYPDHRAEFIQHTQTKVGNTYGSFNVGADWFVTKKTTVGVRLDGAFGKGLQDRYGNTNLNDSIIGYSRIAFLANVNNPYNYLNYNFNAEHLFDTLGTKLKFSMDYSPNTERNDGYFENHLQNSEKTDILDPVIFRSSNTFQYYITSARLDFEKKLGKSFSLETGLKQTFQNISSDFVLQRRDSQTGIYKVDSVFTNIFSYKEQINAGYINLQKAIKKANLQLGLRGENTNVLAESKSSGIKYTRQYFNLFPTFSVDYNPTENNNLQFSYNRRINRPNYNLYNPYKTFFTSILQTGQGNPYLRPEYSNSFEITHNYKGRISNSFSYSLIDNFILGYNYQNDSTKETISLVKNLKNSSNFAYSLYMQQDVRKWWNITFIGTISEFYYKGDVNGLSYKASALSYNAFLTNMFALPKNYKVELNAQYIGPMLYGVNYNQYRWALNFALRKSFLNNKLSLTIGMNDAFFTMIIRNRIHYQNQDATIHVTTDTQRFKFALNYSFGKIKVTQRETKSNQEEKSRLNH
jgi:hypothetical protein